MIITIDAWPVILHIHGTKITIERFHLFFRIRGTIITIEVWPVILHMKGMKIKTERFHLFLE